jgi:hypothetical protein
VVCSAQIMHLSCIDTNTVSKPIDMGFQTTHVTEDFQRVHLKWFPSLWYIRCKPSTYPASRLALSPKTPNQNSTWTMAPRSTIVCVHSDFEPMVYLAQTVHQSCVKISTISKLTEMSFHLSFITKEYNRMHQKWYLSLSYVWHKPCTYLAPTLTLSPNGSKWDSTRPTSPRSCIGCVQNNFWACGVFGANRAPSLHRH